jgi:hypothetical protein
MRTVKRVAAVLCFVLGMSAFFWTLWVHPEGAYWIAVGLLCISIGIAVPAWVICLWKWSGDLFPKERQ